MALPPLPPENTRRYLLEYTVGTETHHMLSRADEFHNDAAAVASLQAVAVALAPSMSDNATFLGVLVAVKGSNVFNAVGGFTPTAGSSGFTLQENAWPFAWSIPGRTPTGRKSRVTVFGIATIVTPNSFEQDPLTDAGLQGFQGLLNSTGGMWLAIDEVKPTWYFRATLNVNDHWVKEQRN